MESGTILMGVSVTSKPETCPALSTVSPAHAFLQHHWTCWHAVMQIFHRSHQEALFVNSTRSRQHWELSSSRWQIQVFQNSDFCLQVWILSWATNSVTAVSPELTGFLHSFSRKQTSNIQVLLTQSVCLLFFQVLNKNDVPEKSG